MWHRRSRDALRAAPLGIVDARTGRRRAKFDGATGAHAGLRLDPDRWTGWYLGGRGFNEGCHKVGDRDVVLMRLPLGVVMGHVERGWGLGVDGRRV